MKVKISAPGKLMLLGEHAVVYGWPCIVTTVDKRLYLEAELLKEKKLIIKAPSAGVRNYKKDLDKLCKNGGPEGGRFVERAVLNFQQKYSLSFGVKIETKNGFSIKYGFGSSAAVTVCTIKALAELSGKKLSNREIFDLSYKTILDVSGVGSGFDAAAAIYGGTLYFVTGGEKIEKISNGEIPLLVGYTGIKADTPTLVKMVAEKKKKDEELITRLFSEISFLVDKAKRAIAEKNWQRLGELMNYNQGYLEALGVNTQKLSNLIYSARNAGCYGAKLSGAGGGDCMIAIVDEKNRENAEKAIKKFAGEIIKVKTGTEGVRVEK